MSTADALYSYLETIRRLTGAPAASLLFSIAGRPGSAPITLHTDAVAPVPELESEPEARQFVNGIDAAKADSEHPVEEGGISYYRSAADDGHLLRITLSEAGLRLHAGQNLGLLAERRKSEWMHTENPICGSAWIGLRYGKEKPPLFISGLRAAAAGQDSDVSVSASDWLAGVLVSGAQMAWQVSQLTSLLQDPTSQLPGRAELQAHLKRVMAEAVQEKRPLGLAFINPDDFGLVNQRLGREHGDAALREIADKLQASLRQADAVFHYGSAVFAAVLWLGDSAEADVAVDRLRMLLSHQTFLNGSVRLGFSAGIAVLQTEAADDRQVDMAELLRRADSALNAAKLSGGGRTMLWAPEGFATAAGVLDRLNGIFTADTEKDYRNMLMLWDTVTVISSHAETGEIATEFVARVRSTFKPKRVGLFAVTEEGEPRLLAATQGTPAGANKSGEHLDLRLSAEQRRLLAEVGQRRRTERVRLSAPGENQQSQRVFIAYAVPLVARETYLGCLYLDGPEDTLVFDSSDLVFLSALANQVAVALDRAELALRWKREQEREKLRLREELRGLRQALHHSRLVYQSSQMQTVLDVLRSVAPTDATVLITGESGTGKEVLARTLHEQSLRRKRAFVTVDCSAIAQSLIEAELFGHKKGAYTGAEGPSQGRIAQAEGGTLLLDEIGELPLDVQAKLLRFVQEKEIIPVGAERSRQVDVRIVTATNRDLAAEVSSGRFRRDLFYRLQVVSVTAPPLRERPDDILPLAHYFLEKFAVQYDKGVRRMSPEAELALLECTWPGNVRELQNRILQAVVTSSGEEIGWRQLRLGSEGAPGPVRNTLSGSADTGRIGDPDSPLFEEPMTRYTERLQENEPSSSEGSDNPWEALRKGLKRQIPLALDSSNGATMPLGRWLTEDLILATEVVHGGIARRASAALGMAETTFRRQVDKAKRQVQSGLSARTPSWSSLKPVISQLVANLNGSADENVVEQARRMLLEEVVVRLPQNDTLGSALMGITVPTYRRWAADLRPATNGSGNIAPIVAA